MANCYNGTSKKIRRRSEDETVCRVIAKRVEIVGGKHQEMNVSDWSNWTSAKNNYPCQG
jgi:hypothetical protein